jgi:hypothetical protein
MTTGQTDRFRKKKEFVGTIFVFTMIGMVAVLLAALPLIYSLKGWDYTLPKYLQLPLFLAAAVPGFLFGVSYAKKQLEKQHWELTDTELSCGRRSRQIFPLGAIEKIIVGLPSGFIGKQLQKDKPGSVAGASLDILSATDPTWSAVRQRYLPARENSLVLCFNDSSWLPICLYAFPNGAAIMDQLKLRFKDRLIYHYNFSPEEVRRLRRRDINELIPK